MDSLGLFTLTSLHHESGGGTHFFDMPMGCINICFLGEVMVPNFDFDLGLIEPVCGQSQLCFLLGIDHGDAANSICINRTALDEWKFITVQG